MGAGAWCRRRPNFVGVPKKVVDAGEAGREGGREGGRALSARDAGLEGGAVAIGAAGGRGDGGEEEEFISIGEEKGGRGGDAQRSRCAR